MLCVHMRSDETKAPKYAIKENDISVLILVSTEECLVSPDKLLANTAQVNCLISQH